MMVGRFSCNRLLASQCTSPNQILLSLNFTSIILNAASPHQELIRYISFISVISALWNSGSGTIKSRAGSGLPIIGPSWTALPSPSYFYLYCNLFCTHAVPLFFSRIILWHPGFHMPSEESKKQNSAAVENIGMILLIKSVSRSFSFGRNIRFLLPKKFESLGIWWRVRVGMGMWGAMGSSGCRVGGWLKSHTGQHRKVQTLSHTVSIATKRKRQRQIQDTASTCFPNLLNDTKRKCQLACPPVITLDNPNFSRLLRSNFIGAINCHLVYCS